MKSYWFLFWAYNVVWAGLVLYLPFPAGRPHARLRRLDQPERRIEQRGRGRSPGAHIGGREERAGALPEQPRHRTGWARKAARATPALQRIHLGAGGSGMAGTTSRVAVARAGRPGKCERSLPGQHQRHAPPWRDQAHHQAG